MAPWFTNESCTPFSSEDSACSIGNYVSYAVNVSSATDVQLALVFATTHNIRFVIRNTGHDYNGKSTGAGALAVWMHHLKDVTFPDWNDPEGYTGKAMKVGAGIQVLEAYEAANKEGFQVVGGECPTVGLAGGYTQGGGHSALASKYGLAADQTLEFEVVTASGELLIANRTLNPDLYWALSGGGGGTYGVVISLTVKAHPDIPVAGFNLTFTSDGISQDLYYDAIAKYNTVLPSLVDNKAMSVWFFTNNSFSISPLTAPGLSADELKSILSPFTNFLTASNISFTSYAADFPDYLSEYKGMQAPIQVGIAQYGGWLVPRTVIENNNTALTNTYRAINNAGGQFIGVGLNVNSTHLSSSSSTNTNTTTNAVLPAWRTVLIDTVLTTPWTFNSRTTMLSNQKKMTEEFIPALKALAPDSGAYLSESDFRQPDWKSAFYGVNYERLESVKRKYDPENTFYALGGVGSDYWSVDEVGGRMCRA